MEAEAKAKAEAEEQARIEAEVKAKEEAEAKARAEAEAKAKAEADAIAAAEKEAADRAAAEQAAIEKAAAEKAAAERAAAEKAAADKLAAEMAAAAKLAAEKEAAEKLAAERAAAEKAAAEKLAAERAAAEKAAAEKLAAERAAAEKAAAEKVAAEKAAAAAQAAADAAVVATLLGIASEAVDAAILEADYELALQEVETMVGVVCDPMRLAAVAFVNDVMWGAGPAAGSAQAAAGGVVDAAALQRQAEARLIALNQLSAQHLDEIFDDPGYFGRAAAEAEEAVRAATEAADAAKAKAKRERGAATRVQRVRRGYQTRKDLVAERKAARAREEEQRILAAEFEEEQRRRATGSRAATQMQARARGMGARGSDDLAQRRAAAEAAAAAALLRRQHAAAVRIQKTYRAMVSRRRTSIFTDRDTRRKLIELSKGFDDDMRRLKARSRAAIVVQRYARGYVARGRTRVARRRAAEATRAILRSLAVSGAPLLACRSARVAHGMPAGCSLTLLPGELKAPGGRRSRSAAATTTRRGGGGGGGGGGGRGRGGGGNQTRLSRPPSRGVAAYFPREINLDKVERAALGLPELASASPRSPLDLGRSPRAPSPLPPAPLFRPDTAASELQVNLATNTYSGENSGRQSPSPAVATLRPIASSGFRASPGAGAGRPATSCAALGTAFQPLPPMGAAAAAEAAMQRPTTVDDMYMEGGGSRLGSRAGPRQSLSQSLYLMAEERQMDKHSHDFSNANHSDLRDIDPHKPPDIVDLEAAAAGAVVPAGTSFSGARRGIYGSSLARVGMELADGSRAAVVDVFNHNGEAATEADVCRRAHRRPPVHEMADGSGGLVDAETLRSRNLLRASEAEMAVQAIEQVAAESAADGKEMRRRYREEYIESLRRKQAIQSAQGDRPASGWAAPPPTQSRRKAESFQWASLEWLEAPAYRKRPLPSSPAQLPALSNAASTAAVAGRAKPQRTPTCGLAGSASAPKILGQKPHARAQPAAAPRQPRGAW